MRKTKPILARMFARSRWAESGCLEWTGAKRGNNGYGSIDVLIFGKQRSQYIHRVSFEIAFGRIPKNMSVLHRCDNPLCFNPSHLFLGTQQDNMIDMTKKGRNVAFHGEKHPMAKLSISDVNSIRALHISGVTHLEISKQFNISRSHIQAICSGKLWRN